MANNVKRMITEDGVVLEKIFKEATNEFKSQDGRVVPAQPDRYYLKVVSGEKFTEEIGFVNSTVLEYRVDEAFFNKVKANSKVVAHYELSNFGAKPMSLGFKM